jgi:hypothetical protein
MILYGEVELRLPKKQWLWQEYVTHIQNTLDILVFKERLDDCHQRFALFKVGPFIPIR